MLQDITSANLAIAKIHFQLKAGQALLARCVLLIGFLIFFSLLYVE